MPCPLPDRVSPIASLVSALCLGFVLALATTPAYGQDPAQKPTQPATEQNPATPAQGHSLHGEAFDEGPRQAAIRLTGMGEVDFAVTTGSPEARVFVNQGVAQLHTFYYLEAERSFRQVAALDPDCAMAYWGMAMANVNNAKRAKAFILEAKNRAKAHEPSRRESLYIDSLAGLYSEEGDDKAKRHKQLEGLETLVQEFPTDVDARCWLALLIWQNNDKDGVGSRQAVEELIRSAERLSPMHPGVHHYRIHLWDNGKPALAEASARLYALAAPGIAHAWHMPGHTYTGLKRYAEAAYQQEGSARVDHAAMSRDRTMPFEIHNYAHNNQWLATSLSHLGRAREAIAIARNLVEQPRDPQKNTPGDGGSAQSSGRARWSEVLTRYERWDELIGVTQSGELDWSDQPRERKEKAYTLGLAYAAKGDVAQLQAQIDLLKALEPPKPPSEPTATPKPESPEPLKDPAAPAAPAPAASTEADKKPAEPAPPVGPPPAPAVAPRTDSAKLPPDPPPPVGPPPGLAEALAELEGHRLLLAGQPEEALKSFEKAGSMRPEARARAQLRAGKPDLALATARTAVEQNANQFAPLAALVEILDAAGKIDEARTVYDQLRPFLDHADKDLPVLTRLATKASQWPPLTASSETGRTSTPPTPAPLLPDLSYFGPLLWRPDDAPAFELPDTESATWRLADHRGRNVVVLFFLGGGCAHCMQQLQEFGKEADALAKLDTDLVAVSSDDAAATRALKHNPDGVAFPMPLLADPTLEFFRRYRCHDDFEHRPLHGTFFVDREGKVRFQRISADPFLDIAFLKQEIARIDRLAGPDRGGSAAH